MAEDTQRIANPPRRRRFLMQHNQNWKRIRRLI
jgi:hypothetical protein